MSANTKKTSPSISSLAAKTLGDPDSSTIAKKLAGSALAQAQTGKQTGADLETLASKALQDRRLSDATQALAATVLAQSNKKR